jgi:hypothetical protein
VVIWLRVFPRQEIRGGESRPPAAALREISPEEEPENPGASPKAPLARRAPLSRLAAQSLAAPWIEAALQRADPGRREEALDAIRTALEGRDELEGYAALLAFTGIREIDFPRGNFRPGIERHLNAVDFGVQRAAWYALFHSDPQRDDIPRIWELADRPGIQASVSHLLNMWEAGDLTRTSGAVVEELLHHEDHRVLKEALRGLWGARFSGALSERVLELTRHPDRNVSHNAVYHALSTQSNKTKDGVERLLELAADQSSTDLSGRSAWGLRQGVPEEFHSWVADHAIGLVETGQDAFLRDAAMDLVMRYSGEEHRAALEVLVTEPDLNPLLQEDLIQAIADLDR